MNFHDIIINHDEIPQSELNIDIKKRTNLFAWNGQFSPQFVEAEITKYASPNMLIIDPFLGSGTVLYECSRKGISAYGTELNVSAYFMSKIYELSNLPTIERTNLLNTIDSIIDEALKSKQFDIYLAQIININTNKKIANILSTLIILLDIYNNDVSEDLVKSKWLSLKNTILGLPYCSAPIRADNGDARCLNIDNDTADMLLTSPPYINVFNYHQKYRASVELLGHDVLSIAKSEFGANRKYRSNRLCTVIQYCIDIALSLKEANRVCKTNSRMIYVVGRESTVLGYSFCNSELVYNLGTLIFGFKCALRQERVFKNRYGQMIYEDIIHFLNTETIDITDNFIINKAKEIAVDMLSQKLSIDNKNKKYLEDAISQATKIKPSEVHNG